MPIGHYPKIVEGRLIPRRSVPAANASRRCLKCCIQAPEYLTQGSRWLHSEYYTTYHRSHKYWTLVCRGCGQIAETEERVPLPDRQKHADLCNECWKAASPEWFSFKEAIEQRKKELAAELEKLQEQINGKRNVLEQYLKYMEDVDDGKSLTDEEPPQPLDGLEIPRREKIRPETIKAQESNAEIEERTKASFEDGEQRVERRDQWSRVIEESE